MPSYICHTCGQEHEGLPTSYGAIAPAYWYGIPENDRGKRARLTRDLCAIDNKDFFIAGNVEIPIIDSPETFSWTVWVSLSEQNFKRTKKLWWSFTREKEPPYFGWLSTELAPCYPTTINLKAHVHTRPVGVRPAIELEATDHPLAVEQRNGIIWARVQEIAEILEHAGSR